MDVDLLPTSPVLSSVRCAVLDGASSRAQDGLVAAGGSEVWRARISRDEADQLRRDAETLGLTSRADVVRAGLAMLRGDLAEERMARSIDAFCAGEVPSAPIGVRRRSRDNR